jgi:hypothetical protein
MVNTRSRARGFLFDQLSQEQRYQLQDLNNNFSQHSQQSNHSQESNHSQHSNENNSQHYSQNDSYDFQHEMGSQSSNTDTNRPTYRQGDECKRHRVRDNEPYSVEVTSYRRRKAH